MTYNIFLLIIYLFYFVHGKPLQTTISYIELESYLGHWFQVYGAPTNIIFQEYGTCITADYGLLENGNITITNKQLDKKGKLKEITGYGYYKNISEPGKLTVHLEGVPYDAPYWIVKLGEIANNEYQYTIITVPSGVSLWVLTRDIDKFMELYDEEVVDFLEEYNFRYELIIQEDCVCMRNSYY